MTFRIVKPDFAMMNVVGFLQNHSARIQRQKFSLYSFQIVHLQPDVMQSGFHPHLAERRMFL